MYTVEFEWDEGNLLKVNSRVSIGEVVELFKLGPSIKLDESHSELELRFLAVGTGSQGKGIFVSFTFRAHRVRVISARYMRKKESAKYEKIKEKK